MPSTRRRDVLAALAATTGLAGCSVPGSNEPPAGSLRLENRDDLPHTVTVRVVDVGARPGDAPDETEGDVVAPPAQRRLSASNALEPGERKTYESVFTEPVWYAVRFEIDGREPATAGATTFHPAPPDRETGRFLAGTVRASGEFAWSVASTTRAGAFALGGTDEG